MLDLNKLETKLNEVLEEETVESLKLWVNMNRIIKTVTMKEFITKIKLLRDEIDLFINHLKQSVE